MKAVILCAGYGERAKPLTDYLPKPLFPILGEPLLTNIILHLKNIGVEEICINIHHLAEKIIDYFGIENYNFDFITTKKFGIKFNIFYEKNLLGISGGVSNMRKFLIQEPFFIVYNGDILTNINIKPAIDYHIKERPIATLILHKNIQFNNVSVSEGIITNIGKGDFAFTGISIMGNEIFDFLCSPIIEVYRKLIQLKKLRGYICSGHFWQDIGDIKRYIDAHKSILIDKINALQKKIAIQGSIFIGEDSKISKSAKLNGFVSIGKNCIIEDNAYLENCIVWDNVIVKKDTIAKNTCIYKN